jgi:hypothetical protein
LNLFLEGDYVLCEHKPQSVPALDLVG